MNDRVTIYAVPEAIASELNLSRIRVHDGKRDALKKKALKRDLERM